MSANKFYIKKSRLDTHILRPFQLKRKMSKKSAVREGTFFIGGGGPGPRRGGSFVNILQIGEGQTSFICNRGRVIVIWQGKNYSMSVS